MTSALPTINPAAGVAAGKLTIEQAQADVETTADEVELTVRFKNSNQARDALDAALDAGELDLSGPECSIFRYLIDHVWFKHQDPAKLGFVTKHAIGNKVIARRTSVNEKTVKRAIPELDRKGLIVRYEGESMPTGGRLPDDIRVDWAMTPAETGSEDDTPERVVPMGTESPLTGDTESPSSLPVKEQTEEHHHDDDAGMGLVEAPAGPGQASTVEDSPASTGDGPHGFDWDGPDDGEALAETLGVPLASIHKPFRNWIDSLIRSGDIDVVGDPDDPTTAVDFLAFLYAAQDSACKRNPVGYMRTVLLDYVAELRSIGEDAFKAKHRPDPDSSVQADESGPWAQPVSTAPGWSEIVASFRGYHEAKRVRPRAGVALMSPGAETSNVVPVWYNPRLDLVYRGRHSDSSKYPGPQWEPRIMHPSAWDYVKDRDVIELAD